MREIEIERVITVASLINSAIFYAITIMVFLMARKTRLNKALATQKTIWLIIVSLIALPAYALRESWLTSWERMFIWLALALATWWVLLEVYRANWPWGWRAFVYATASEIKRLPKRGCKLLSGRLDIVCGHWRKGRQ